MKKVRKTTARVQMATVLKRFWQHFEPLSCTISKTAIRVSWWTYWCQFYAPFFNITASSHKLPISYFSTQSQLRGTIQNVEVPEMILMRYVEATETGVSIELSSLFPSTHCWTSALLTCCCHWTSAILQR